MAVLPLHSVERERIFSQMNISKTKLRNRMAAVMLGAELAVKHIKHNYCKKKVVLEHLKRAVDAVAQKHELRVDESDADVSE